MSNSVPKHTITEISFLGSFPRADMTPPLEAPEFAFVGRSNVGKSSLINCLVNRKNLARTSSTPGKTQLINLFQINNSWVLADLPGYGYARTSKKNRSGWGVMIEKYLRHRANLATAFVLIDSRIPPQKIDVDQIEWMAQEAVPFSIVFTKVDKQKPELTQKTINSFMDQLSRFLEERPNYFITSSEKKTGIDELLDYISFVGSQYEKS